VYGAPQVSGAPGAQIGEFAGSDGVALGHLIAALGIEPGAGFGHGAAAAALVFGAKGAPGKWASAWRWARGAAVAVALLAG